MTDVVPQFQAPDQPAQYYNSNPAGQMQSIEPAQSGEKQNVNFHVGASPTQSPDAASPAPLNSPGWIPSTYAAEGAVSPSSSDAVANAGGAIPESVSEQTQQEDKAKADAEELKKAGWFKQNIAKVKSNLCGPLHIGDAVFIAWILLWIIVTGTSKTSIKWLWLVIFLISYLWYISWNWKSDEKAFIWTMRTVDDFEQWWKTLRAATPVISMRTQSWHWERRTHTTTTYNGSGYTTSTSVSYVKVISHTEEMSFNYRVCVDNSLDVEGSDLQKNNATFVHCWKEYSFGDGNTAAAYYNQLTALKQRNIGRDKEMDTAEWMTIPGWQARVGVYRDGSRPILLRNFVFAIAVICLLSWPMKLYMEFVAKKGGFTMKKRVTL